MRNDNFHMVKVRFQIRSRLFNFRECLKKLQLILQASPRMPYRALFLMRDIMFRTNYARDARLSAAKVRQFAHFFALVLAQPRSLQESARGIVRLCLGERPADRVHLLPLPRRIQDYVLLKDSALRDFYD